ncbi:hypothetical protein HLB23_10780 [Nocardia uniformis]|uniref:Carboxypeptidase regulatory-like domain-containing protein n=1 Tax=Nocardia uniformis TaxID=53432 RepID=A0A849BUR0_9NOCA|nr:prealbumin-like fold domain-containing protein [Nocardia uniformis]NNH70343.1 hypothetical protein [Nocardia uniformis]
MRNTLIVTALATMPLLGAALIPASAAAEGPGDNWLRVSAAHGAELFPIADVTADVADCAGTFLATVTTGADGVGIYNASPGCYRVTLTAPPAGCTLAGEPTQQVAVIPGMIQTANYTFRCA